MAAENELAKLSILGFLLLLVECLEFHFDHLGNSEKAWVADLVPQRP